MLTDKRIGILMGGVSSEREISLRSGTAIYSAFKEMGYNVVAIDVDKDISNTIKVEKIEVAFIALHGGWGENGAIQGMLEIIGIPYTGAGILSSALAMDKVSSRKLFEQHGLKVPSYIVLEEKAASLEEIQGKLQDSGLKPPLVIKPSREGSSIGINIIYKWEELDDAVKTAFCYGDSIIIEGFIDGKEIHIGILDNKALGAIEVRPKEGFYNYKAKYTQGLTDYIYPPEISDKEYSKSLEAGLKAHIALGCEGATRVDLIVSRQGVPYILEVNTLPGMTVTSLLPKIAQGAGISFNELVEKILSSALKREMQVKAV